MLVRMVVTLPIGNSKKHCVFVVVTGDTWDG